MAKEFDYKQYRKIRGKIKLDNEQDENIAKLMADGYSLERIQKYIAITDAEYNTLNSDVYFQARYQQLKAEREKAEKPPTSPDELIQLGVSRLITLSKNAKGQDRSKVEAAKSLVQVGASMKKSGTMHRPLSKEDASNKEALKKAMGA